MDNVKKVKAPKYVPKIAKKAVARTKQDIASWNTALNLTKIEENPKYHLLQQLYDEISLDALFTSQYKNRQLKTLSETILIKNAAGEVDEEQTKLINQSKFTLDINKAILDSIYRGYSLIELSLSEVQGIKVDSIPRANLDPEGGFLYPDYTEDTKINYRKVPEYGIWLLEFGEKGDVGLMNHAVPHILFKRFAQSCWSELCEIYGIPPRFMKTNTQDPEAVKRAEEMMSDMGAAAWFIIDEAEEFEFAKGIDTNGDVYSNLINLCNNEISLLISGAVIGQDTKHGNESKEQSSQEMLQTLINSDLGMLEQYWNTIVIPALIKIGILKGEVSYAYEQAEDLETLWSMTREALPYYDVKADWIKEKFGIEVEAKREQNNQNQNLKFDSDFFD